MRCWPEIGNEQIQLVLPAERDVNTRSAALRLGSEPRDGDDDERQVVRRFARRVVVSKPQWPRPGVCVLRDGIEHDALLESSERLLPPERDAVLDRRAGDGFRTEWLIQAARCFRHIEQLLSVIGAHADIDAHILKLKSIIPGL